MNTIETKIIDNFLPEDVLDDFMTPLLSGEMPLHYVPTNSDHNPSGYNYNRLLTDPATWKHVPGCLCSHLIMCHQ